MMARGCMVLVAYFRLERVGKVATSARPLQLLGSNWRPRELNAESSTPRWERDPRRDVTDDLHRERFCEFARIESVPMPTIPVFRTASRSRAYAFSPPFCGTR